MSAAKHNSVRGLAFKTERKLGIKLQILLSLRGKRMAGSGVAVLYRLESHTVAMSSLDD